jgi:hypothetical protein
VRLFNGYYARGMIGADLLWTVFNHQVQSLCQREMTMWMYPRPSCPDHPFSEDLGDIEINTQIHWVLAHGAVLNLGAGPVPLSEGVGIPWVSPLGPTFRYLFQFQLLNVYMFLRRVSSVLTVPLKGPPYLRMW